MVKTKQKRTGKVPGKKSGTSSHDLVDSRNFDNQHEDSDWVIVKKQRVTILVPAAPLKERSANQGPNHTQLMPPELASNHVRLPIETSTIHPSGNEHEKTTLLTGQKETRTERRAPPILPKPTVVNPPSVDQRTESDNPRQMNSLKSHKQHGISDTSKVIKQPRILLPPRRPSNLETLNKNLRASNLERKLERAGGLSKWLTSLGLGQFVRIFQGKGLSKYQLVNLTMKKLKDMGANAVGPRRKLIHAMDCVCQPYCFETL
ncbi:unnamed protein product [Sphenostylis stenocarpa]|uniref:SAM domain-containing protein n=1 Tax=Sphenostylis stenocarpa TaxID=92480 RepID=A0AA86S3R7_9FABA|nr:unnamed protein product [Sphenostylis stenocarpa]